MAETQQDDQTKAETPEIKLDKIAVGSFPDMGGRPAHWAKSLVFDRAGVPHQVKKDAGSEEMQPHKLRAGLKHTHATHAGPGIAKLPDTFPPKDFKGRLEYAQDWLDLIDQCAVMPPPPKEAKTEEPQGEIGPPGETAKGRKSP